MCKEQLEREGLTTHLYTTAMHAMDLPRRYRVIFACGVIGLGGEHKLTMQAMKRCHEHLRPGGIFGLDYMVRWNDPPAWLSRLSENRHALPQKWPFSGDRKTLPDGSELELIARTVSTDPLQNVSVRQIKVRLWENDQLIKEEIYTQKLDDYNKNELMLMLAQAGFNDIKIYGDFENEPATADSKDLVFIAKK